MLFRKLHARTSSLLQIRSKMSPHFIIEYGCFRSTQHFHMILALCLILCALFTTYYRVCNQIITMGATSGAGTAYPSGAPEFTPGFLWGSCYSIFSFICMFCRSLFDLLYFFFWPLCCLFFFDIRILIVLQVSSSTSNHNI